MEFVALSFARERRRERHCRYAMRTTITLTRAATAATRPSAAAAAAAGTRDMGWLPRGRWMLPLSCGVPKHVSGIRGSAPLAWAAAATGGAAAPSRAWVPSGATWAAAGAARTFTTSPKTNPIQSSGAAAAVAEEAALSVVKGAGAPRRAWGAVAAFTTSPAAAAKSSFPRLATGWGTAG